MEPTARGLEFVVGTHRIVVPAEFVERIVETEVSAAPPLARAFITGLGVHDGAIFTVVDLGRVAREPVPSSRPPSNAPSETAQCVLLETRKIGLPLRWALKVNRTENFVQVTTAARSATLPTDWPAWVGGAVTTDGSPVGLLDVEAMLRDYLR